MTMINKGVLLRSLPSKGTDDVPHRLLAILQTFGELNVWRTFITWETRSHKMELLKEVHPDNLQIM